jgi:hypothetical protein
MKCCFTNFKRFSSCINQQKKISTSIVFLFQTNQTFSFFFLFPKQLQIGTRPEKRRISDYVRGVRGEGAREKSEVSSQQSGRVDKKVRFGLLFA